MWGCVPGSHQETTAAAAAADPFLHRSVVALDGCCLDYSAEGFSQPISESNISRLI